jgi:hypothetical protein
MAYERAIRAAIMDYTNRSFALTAVAVLFLFSSSLAACSSDPSTSVRQELPGDTTAWAPTGPRTVGSYDFATIPQPNGFHTMHVGPNNSDNVWVAVAPELELDWVAETSFFVPEGPTYDNEGNLYFSPLFPQEDVSLISLDAVTGERNWAISGNGSNAGSGAILILNDPDNPGDQIIYHVTYTEAMALRPDGSEIWRRPTGLTLPPIVPGERSTTHSFGFNYHPQTDSVIALMMGGEILAFDRSTGEPKAPQGQIPGSPAASNELALPQAVVDQSNALTDLVFGQTPSGLSFFSVIVDVIFGGGSVVTNYFAIDPNTGLIFVAATAPDEDDGTVDGVSELGAIYTLDFVDDGSGGLELAVLNSAQFEGGTGSTPTVTDDGARVFVSDNLGNVIALDSELNELWRFDLGAPVAASIAVSPDNGEVYAVTRTDVFRLTDDGDSATLDWTAALEAFAGDTDVEVEFQALTPTIAANGIAISIGGGKLVADREVMLKVGVGLLDRDTGELRSFTLGREESIAVTSVAPDGGIYTASSPVRRVSGKALFSDLTEDVIGGISRYKPVRTLLLARDAACAAGVRALNAASIEGTDPKSAARDLEQIDVLVEQARAALLTASAGGEILLDPMMGLDLALRAAKEQLTLSGLRVGGDQLVRICVEIPTFEGGAP